MSDLDAFEEAFDEAAREVDVSREEALTRAVVALAEANDVDVPTVAELAALRDDVEDLSADLENLTGDVDEKVQDLRERVVKIYREAERKAPADHDHPELTSSIEELHATVEDLAGAVASEGSPELGEDVSDRDVDAPGRSDDLAALETAVDEVEATVADVADRLSDLEAASGEIDDRIESVESTLADRADRDEDVSEKLSRVASAVVGVQRRLRTVERRTADAEALARLTATANVHGVRKAACEHCGESVRLALLAKPRCPHCDREFSDLQPKSGFFGTSTLTVGDPPALEGQVAGADPDGSAGGRDVPTDRPAADGRGER